VRWPVRSLANGWRTYPDGSPRRGWVVQMATIGLLIVGAVSWQALPDYCRLPVSFAMGLVIVAATVYVQRLRMRLP